MILRYKVFYRIQQIATSILYLCLAVSLAALIAYLMDRDYSDKTLFMLLLIMRYSASVLCICSLYKLLFNAFHFLRRPSVLRAMKNLLYLFFIAYGVLIIIIESFITIIAGGNE
uniref:Uncharacterized protein n=1 Tax=uncultured bacterium contig00060 TaxID=1181543 RepID=A0A806KME7_9BACT|nr:hypothetical protein [uncultured bacterium contig00060]